MKKEKIISLSLVGLLFLSGCGSDVRNNKEIESESAEVTDTQVESKVFEAGTHIIKYVEVKDRFGDAIHYNDGFDEECPIVPEGYACFDVESFASDMNGCTEGYTYFFINEVDVEVQGVLNQKTNTIEYATPGKPIENKLTLN